AVLVSRAADDRRRGVADQLLDQPDGLGGRRDADPRVGAQPQAQHEVIPGRRAGPGNEFIGVGGIVLGTAQPVGFLGRERGGAGARGGGGAPLGQVSRRFEGSYTGRNHGGETARIPLSPSTTVSRTSAAVGATKAIRRAWPDSARWRTHSAAQRLFPAPRPMSSNQVRQSPPGGR